ncbi:MAG: oligoribonuclease [Desulfobacterales bacterium]|nr:oligoribonuclease [Desulfobacterales bacterium]
MKKKLENHLFWIDLEMTGLDPDKYFILEIASIVTDKHLNIIAQGPEIAIHYSDDVLYSMEEWSQEHHQASGLIDRSRTSPCDCQNAEQETIGFLSRYCEKTRPPLCGNSVWQDRRFLVKHMPRLEALLHYRNIDVSSIKELVRMWYPALPPFRKQKSHLAMSDIKDSIKELKYYRDKAFIRQD